MPARNSARSPTGDLLLLLTRSVPRSRLDVSRPDRVSVRTVSVSYLFGVLQSRLGALNYLCFVQEHRVCRCAMFDSWSGMID